MSFEDTIKRVNRFIETTEASKIFGPKTEMFRKIVKSIIKQCEAMDRDEKVIPSDDFIKAVKEHLVFLKHLAIESPMTQNSRLWTSEFTWLILNWNKNLSVPTKEINDEALYCHRLINLELTLIELMNVAKSITYRARQMENYAIPAIKLSEHYRKTLEGNIDGPTSDNNK